MCILLTVTLELPTTCILCKPLPFLYLGIGSLEAYNSFCFCISRTTWSISSLSRYPCTLLYSFEIESAPSLSMDYNINNNKYFF